MGRRGSADALLLLSLLSAFCSCLVSSNYNRSICLNAVQTWANEELETISKEESIDLKDLLFFLHIPRTGGRTIHFCLLRHLYDPKELCDDSYDKLRFNESKHCKFLATHDDYSVIEKLPRHRTSVVTMMRHPIARIFGAYEFSVEVASRFLGMKQQPASLLEKEKPDTTNTTGTSTLDVWPWKYLVTFMRDDILQRDRIRQSTTTSFSADNPYNASTFVMPLQDFISSPIAMYLLHNGATLQVAGLTDNSHLENGGDLRSCIFKYPDLGFYALKIAKRRLDKMPLVGLTEKHKESAVLFAHMFGNRTFLQMENGSLSSNSSTSTTSHKASADFDISNGIPTKEFQEHKSAESSSTIASKTTIDKIISTYQSCADSERKSYSSRRNKSMQNIAPLKFSNEARKHISKELWAEILQLNRLDVELYKHAQGLFAKKQDLLNNQLKSKEKGLQRMGGSELLETSYSQALPLWLPNDYPALANMVLMVSCITIIAIGLFFLIRKRNRARLSFGGDRRTHLKV